MGSAKGWLKKTLLRSAALSFAGRFATPSAVILTYHSVVEDPSLTDHIFGGSRARVHFEQHMKMVAENFSPVTIGDIAEFSRSGRRLPPRPVAVTFDDGFADNYEVALPVLNRYGVPATFYIMVDAVQNGVVPWYCRLRFAFNTTRKLSWKLPTESHVFSLNSPADRKTALSRAWDTGARLTAFVQQEFIERVERELETEPLQAPHGFMLTWDQVRAMRKAGHTIGAHTLSHPNVAHVSRSEANTEISDSKKRLEKELVEAVDHFSYPHPALNPQWSDQTLDITREAGFKSAVLTARGPVRAGDEPLALKRIYTTGDLAQFQWNLQCTFLGRSI